MRKPAIRSIFRSPSAPTDFVLRRHPPGLGPSGAACDLGGLASDTRASSWADGNLGDKWWFAIGASKQHPPTATATMPGPCNAGSVPVDLVELYVTLQ